MMQVKLVPESQVACQVLQLEVMQDVKGLQSLDHQMPDFKQVACSQPGSQVLGGGLRQISCGCRFQRKRGRSYLDSPGRTVNFSGQSAPCLIHCFKSAFC